MSMLNFWHKKAIELSEAYWAALPKNKPDDDPEYDAIYNAKWDTFEAAFCASITWPSELDYLMKIIVRHAADSGDEELVTGERIAVIARAAAKLAEPIHPKKRVGKLARGKKLTRAGLLFRYQSFLIQELQTLSYELYGERDFATSFVAYDQEVDRRCKSRRRAHPFFDPTTLTTRASTVLKSLKIDSVKADSNAVRLSGSKGGSR